MKVLMKVLAWLTFIFDMWVMIIVAIAIIACIAKFLASPEDWRAMTGYFSSSWLYKYTKI